MVAITVNKINTVIFLLKNGADCTILNGKDTALSLAKDRQFKDIEVLLSLKRIKSESTDSTDSSFSQ